MLAKEDRERWGERGHCVSPRCNASPASAMWVMSVGLAWRYQYVSVTCAWPRYVLSPIMWRDTAAALRGHRSREWTAKLWRRSWIRGPRRPGDPRSPMDRVNCRKMAMTVG